MDKRVMADEIRLFVDGRAIGGRFHVAHRVSGAPYGLNRLHGHTYEVRVEVVGEYQRGEIVFPFEKVMDILRDCIAGMNNKVLLAKDGGNVCKYEGDFIRYVSADGKQYSFPKEDVMLLPVNEVTAEAITEYLLNRIIEKVREEKESEGYKVRFVKIILWEGFERGSEMEKRID